MFEKLEKMRKRTLFLMMMVWIATIAVTVLFFAASMKTPYLDRNWIKLVIYIPLLIAGAIQANMTGKYKEKFRSTFYKDVLKDNSYRLSFEDSVSFGAAEIKNWGILPNVIHTHIQDVVRGSKEGYDFLVCQLDVVGKQRIEGPDAWFHGLYIMIDLKEKVKGTVHVRTLENLHMEQHENLFTPWNIELPSVKTGASWFDETMKVSSDHPEEATLLLTEQRMRKLVRLHQNYRHRIWFGFVDGELHVAIEQGKSFFQPSLFGKVNEKTLEKQRESIEELKNLINEIL